MRDVFVLGRMKMVFPFVSDEDSIVFSNRIPLWNTVRNHVIQHRPFSPVEFFRHVLRVYCSKTKGGLNKASQMRAAMNHPGGCSKWEENILIQVFRTLIIYGLAA